MRERKYDDAGLTPKERFQERTKLGTLDFAEMNRRAEEMISSLGVNIKADTIVENLTIAQQQMVEIVKAVSFNGNCT